MKTLLRSCFVADGDDGRQDLHTKNVLTLAETGLTFDIIEDQTIFNVTRDFVRAHGHAPDISTLREHFKRKNEDQVWNRLEQLVILKPIVQGDFLARLRQCDDDRRKRLWGELLKEASVITSTGMEVIEGRDKRHLQGPDAAAQYLAEKAPTILASRSTAAWQGTLADRTKAILDGYKTRKEGSGAYHPTGFHPIDKAFSGLRPGQLWVHCGFTGGCKSTFALNYAYNLAHGATYRRKVILYSLEMGNHPPTTALPASPT